MWYLLLHFIYSNTTGRSKFIEPKNIYLEIFTRCLGKMYANWEKKIAKFCEEKPPYIGGISNQTKKKSLESIPR
jgi:hypothetical protein